MDKTSQLWFGSIQKYLWKVKSLISCSYLQIDCIDSDEVISNDMTFCIAVWK